MARRALGVACALAVAAYAAASAANAQTLALMHVKSFVLSVDKSTVAVGEPFHLTLSAHVDRRIESLDNVQLPSLAGFEDLGDERRCTKAASGDGSDCVETVTLDAGAPGDRSIGPAAVEFIDATSGHIGSMQSNVVTVHVTGTAKSTPDSAETPEAVGENPIDDLLWSAMRTFGIFICVAIAAYALIWGFHRRTIRPADVPIAVPVPLPDVPPAPDWSARMRELGTFLGDQPSRARALAVRAELRTHIGAGERETIADLIKRDAARGDDAVMTALGAVERAAFCEEANVAAAAREAVPFLMR